MIRVFIVDDHEMIREGIKSALSDEADLEVIGEARSGEEALQQVPDLVPDLVIMDINMAGISGIETTTQLLSDYPDLKILGLTMYEDANHIINMLQAGASGYILKGSGSDIMIEAIRTVAKGENYYSREVSSKLMNQFIKPKDAGNEQVHLTARETEILKLIAEEHTNQEIAEQLFISQRTVDTHRRNLIQKLNAKNTAGLVRYAIKHNLISL